MPGGPVASMNLNLNFLNDRLEKASPEDILRWAWNTFSPNIVASSSFQTQSVPLLHLISQITPSMKIIFIDTGYHFPETLTFCDELKNRLALNITVVRSAIEQSGQLEKYGESLYRHDPDACCYMNKVEPMQRALEGMNALVTGIRHDQTSHRSKMKIVERRASGLYEIHPLIHWSREQIFTYIQKHQLPRHPLLAKGYMSIGCAPCTQPVSLDQHERAGRWTGTTKTECGLHLDGSHHGRKGHEQKTA